MQEAHPHSQLPDYSEVAKTFSFDDVAATFLQGSLDEGLNACIECCDRHDGATRALDCIDEKGVLRSYTFAELRELSARVANVLASRGVGPGDVVAGLLPRTVELVATVLGAWRAGAVYQPLFTAFGPKAIEHRLELSAAKLVVTNAAQRGKLDGMTQARVVVCVSNGEPLVHQDDVDFHKAIDAEMPNFKPVARKGTDLFLMMSTSGTTGPAKAVPVPLRALVSFGMYMHYGIGLRAEDKYWNIADPGWAYGLYYAVIGPLLTGHATTLYEGAFQPQTTYDLIRRLGITSLAGSPTAFRMLMAAGSAAAVPVKGQLRRVSSAGEPLNPEVIAWFATELAVPIRDHYGQTETGMIVNNHHGLAQPFRAGSAGLPMPGYRIAVIDENGTEVPPRTQGVLAVDRQHSPLFWFTGYYKQETKALSEKYYATGDTVELDFDGSLSFVGRADDVITSSGYRIGPFDVESALLEHRAVVEAAVIGVPDAERTEIVKAYVVLAEGYSGSTQLAEELSLHVKVRLSAHAYPRIVDFVHSLPKTPSGKIQRFLLREAAKAAAVNRPYQA